jgi:hypothetical protein
MRMNIPKILRPAAIVGLILGAALLLLLPASSVYYEYTGGASCARCHEIRETWQVWQASTHRGVACSECHGGVLTLDASFHANNLKRVISHVRDGVPENLQIGHTHVRDLVARCQRCHQQEFAQWQSGPHASTYERIFLDKAHNSKQRVMDDCLRCHGAHYSGSVATLLTPVNTAGPWTIRDGSASNLPAIPCLACHQIHRQGEPMRKPVQQVAALASQQERHRPSLALFDRRSGMHIGASELPVPPMLEGARLVRMSNDPRQALCYQCHAPAPTQQVRSGDDRTPVGVHEGLSCVACHQKHGQQTHASCSTCHPRLSNCGLDVETMDTTFRNPQSRHNIHFVKCADCHEKGIPARKKTAPPRALPVSVALTAE